MYVSNEIEKVICRKVSQRLLTKIERRILLQTIVMPNYGFFSKSSFLSSSHLSMLFLAHRYTFLRNNIVLGQARGGGGGGH